MTYDVIVIGIGLAGLTAGVRLAQAGRRVLMLAKGVGGTHLGGGTIDVLGYGDGLIERPAAALPDFLAARPDHPYARTGLSVLRAAAAWFLRTQEAGGYPFAGSVEDNHLLPTAAGAVKPSALVPRSMTGGDLRSGGQVVIVGFRNLKDFYPALLSDNLTHATLPGRAGVSARPILVDPPGLAGEADLSPLDLARAFDRPDFRATLAADVRSQLRPGERVGFPAVIGLRDPLAAWQDLQARVGAPVFEIPTLPPSIPGMRIFERLDRALRAAGARVHIGFPVIEAHVARGRCTGVTTGGAARPLTWRAQHVVLAAGGIASGGIVAESDGTVREAVFGLPLSGLPAPETPRFLPGYFDRHPFNRVGLVVDDSLRPLDGEGHPAIINVRAAGAMLAHAEPWREQSGDGISLATGYRAADSILEEPR